MTISELSARRVRRVSREGFLRYLARPFVAPTDHARHIRLGALMRPEAIRAAAVGYVYGMMGLWQANELLADRCKPSVVRDAVNYLLEGADMEKVRLEQPGVPLASLRAGADYMSDAARGITHPMLAAAFRDAARELRRMAVEAEHVNREVEGVK